jgi:acetyl-CoA carboxylase biotin carboxyl carrier protein
MKIDFDQIRELLEVFGQADITELTVESGEEKITLKKAGHQVVTELRSIPGSNVISMVPPLPSESQPVARVDAGQSEPNGLVPVASPMVGTFYRSPSPSAPSFVEIGDMIAIGQTVCIIEAMKLMNDLPAEVAGRIVKVCVENGTTVEYGQPLFMVDPRG